MTVLTLTKHHGIGNDFLVTFADDPPAGAQWDEVARRVCHRRRGVGADGLLVAVPGAKWRGRRNASLQRRRHHG